MGRDEKSRAKEKMNTKWQKTAGVCEKSWTSTQIFNYVKRDRMYNVTDFIKAKEWMKKGKKDRKCELEFGFNSRVVKKETEQAWNWEVGTGKRY